MYQILIADDEKNSRDGLISLDWGKFNISVATAVSNGLDAYNYILSNHVDIILTDIKMPFMDGIELVRKVHENFPEIISVVLSGYDDYKYLRECLQNNVYDYMLKPLKPDELTSTFNHITRVLDIRRAESSDDSSFSADTSENFVNSKKHITDLAQQYINQHYKEPITLNTLAAHIHVSPTYLSRILNMELDMGLPDLVNNLRIKKAKEMLSDHNLRINEISEALGYNSTQYFTRTFKKLTGFTPLDYRNK